jgi:hypothetical protein
MHHERWALPILGHFTPIGPILTHFGVGVLTQLEVRNGSIIQTRYLRSHSGGPRGAFRRAVTSPQNRLENLFIQASYRIPFRIA